MTGNDQRVAIITGGSHGIGAGLVAGYRGRGWAPRNSQIAGR
jgi:NAD(P)-dependent dehydrogenase (short-subunit alcohol dehydrogenase family)